MKSILLPVSSKEALNVLNGDQTLLLLKSVPKDFVGWVYVYVTRKKPHLQVFDDEIIKIYPKTPKYICENDFHGTTDLLSGTIPFRFWFDEYDKYVDVSNCGMTSCGVECENDFTYTLYYLDNELEKLCLTYNEVYYYGQGKDLYAWHIKKIEIFPETKKLVEFKLNRPPQSWCYIYE